MADRISPPMRRQRYGEEPAKPKKSREKDEKSRTRFQKSKWSDFMMLGSFDVPFFALVMILLAIGLVMLL